MPDIPEIPLPAPSREGERPREPISSENTNSDLQSGSGVPAAVPPEPDTPDNATPSPPEAPAESPALARKRRGKVARLPKEIRDD